MYYRRIEHYPIDVEHGLQFNTRSERDVRPSASEDSSCRRSFSDQCLRIYGRRQFISQQESQADSILSQHVFVKFKDVMKKVCFFGDPKQRQNSRISFR